MQQLQQLLPIALIIGVFYFLVIRPQQKRAAAQRKMLAAIKPGDEVVTIGGIFAVVLSVDDRIRAKLADGSELELSKQAIAQVIPPKDGSADAAVDAGDAGAPDDETKTLPIDSGTPDA